MASTILDHLLVEARYLEAIEVAEVMLEHWPRDTYAMTKQGAACGYLIEDFKRHYPSPFLIPMPERSRYLMLVERNRAAFERPRRWAGAGGMMLIPKMTRHKERSKTWI